MRVAVIGAGCCGVTAVKACLEENLDVVCFERAADSGGLWWYREDAPAGTGTVMRFTVANTSKEMSCYSDFPPPKEAPLFMNHKQTLQYIRDYAEHFGVSTRIRYKHEVIRLDKDGTLKVRDLEKGREFEEVFDGVLVCTGHHATPLMPDVPGMAKYRGRILHSHQYKYADEEMRGKKAVVVGMANSAVDVAVNLTSVAEQVFLSTRRINWILPVHYRGIPLDVYLFKQMRLWLYSWLPKSYFSRLMIRCCNESWNHKIFNLEAKHDVLAQGAVINAFIDGKLLDGSIKIRGPPERFTEKGVVMNGVEEEVDLVVFATGYRSDVPFASDALPRDGHYFPLYKMIIPPQNPNVAFLGFVDAGANLLQAFEMQARYVVQVFCGKVTLPSVDAMKTDIAAVQNAMKAFYISTPRHSLMIDRIAYVDDLARVIGAKPNYWKMFFSDPKLYWKLMLSPVLNYQYRLEGPHSWKGARDAILNFDERMQAPFGVSARNTESGTRIYTWAFALAVLTCCACVKTKLGKSIWVSVIEYGSRVSDLSAFNTSLRMPW
ncbi:unnamed protein product [Ixodes hexagonus]